jgi:predicted TIM-barrel fold metal-dependent hydrolase
MTHHIIDSHCHLGESLYGQKQTPEGLVKLMDKNNVDKAIVFPFTPPDLDFKNGNDMIAKAVAKYPDRLIGFGRVDPRQVNSSLAEVQRIVTKLKLSGLKVHPFEQAFRINSDLVRPIFRKCSSLGIPVFTSGGAPVVSTASQVGDMASELPDLTIIAAHCSQLDGSGMGEFDALAALRENKNLFVETSGFPETRLDGFWEMVIKAVSAKRLIYGSDSPGMNMAVEIMRVTATDMTEAQQAQVLSENIAGILDLK